MSERKALALAYAGVALMLLAANGLGGGIGWFVGAVLLGAGVGYWIGVR